MTYQIFKKWCGVKNKNTSEKILLAYLVERNGKLKAAGSLWAEYSMLKATIFLHESINISKFSTLIAFLKRKNVGYKPKKASVFTKDEMFKFLIEALDELFLIHKVAMILGVAGACRREELYKMTIKDIEDRESFIIITISNTKTNIQRTFTVINKKNEKINYLRIVRKYIKLRPNNAKSLHLFLNYRNGKCKNQVVGKGTIGALSSKMAEYLKLENAVNYTGHSFRRTSATLLANKGVDVLGLKRHGGWKSSTVAESYVEDSLQNKNQFAEKILHDDNESPCSVSDNILQSSACASTSRTFSVDTNTEKSNISISISSCNNCTFNFK
ncbi:uncharacterized protein [Onthophagus taurus]|uniref:uncharacterized protein n=1 Tax=Onthophagus taurus TaxID=166361 RepID=UPI0039BDDF16